MKSTTLRARLVIALLMIAGSFSVALVADGASAARPYAVNLTVTDSRPDVGQSVKLSGKVTPKAPGKRVLVQGKAAGTGWVTIATRTLSPSSTYKASLSFSRAGRVALRVVKAASRTVLEGTSPVRALQVGGRQTPPQIITTSLPAGAVGVAYSATVETADLRAGAFTIATGSLPAGLSLDDQSGDITGTPTTQGTSSFEVVFTDPDGLSDAKLFSIVVGPGAQAPVISTTTLPNGSVGSSYTATMQTVGNKTGTWSVTNGAFPAGLTGNTATGVISGTPTLAGTFTFTAKFVETATGLSDTQTLAVTVTPATAPVISTTTLPAGTVNTTYAATLQTVGNKTGVWAVTVGALPAGLTLAPATGAITGKPTVANTANFTVRFTEAGTGLTDSQALSLAVAAAPAPVISTASLPAGAVTKPYFAQLATVGNKTGTWTKTVGNFPAGLTLNAATGVISGTPTTAGSQTFTIRFQETGGLSDSRIFQIFVDSNTAPVISTTTLPAGEVGAAYTTTLATVGNRTGSWSLSTGALPLGLSLNGATGVISGSPTSAGTASFSVVFTTTGGLTDSQALSIVVAAATAPIISTSSLPAGTVGQAYSSTLLTVGNKTGSWSVSSGAVPAGLSLNGATGVINGTPTTAGTASFTVVFTATSGLTDTQALSILVDPNTPPVIQTTSLANGTVGVAYTQTLTTVGNRTGSWSLASGSLPAGVTLNGATGVISGTPTTAATSNFIVQFTATGGLTDSQVLSITVAPAIP
jgi:hypothetical protein